MTSAFFFNLLGRREAQTENGGGRAEHVPQ